MQNLKKYQDGLNQAQAVVKFLSSVSGIMAGLTAVLPFSGQLFDFVKEEDFRDITPGMVTTLSMMLSCYVLMYMVNLRDDIRMRPMRKVRRQSLSRLIAAFIAFTMYVVVLENALLVDAGIQWLAMVFYAAFFACAMYAFALMGMKEYLGEASPALQAAAEEAK